eukprot:EG_transcript_11340
MAPDPTAAMAQRGPTAAVVLPAEVWGAVADFLQTPAVSHLCRATWAALRGRHLRLDVRRCAAATDICPLAFDMGALLHTLRVGGKSPNPASLPFRPPASLRSLHLQANSVPLDEIALRDMLEALSVDSLLTCLSLDLDHCGLQAFAFEGLQPGRLRSVHLSLSCNTVREEGAVALSQLSLRPGLLDFSLTLRGSALQPDALTPLLAACGSPSLRSLRLDVAYNALGPRGPPPLAALRPGGTLQALTLCLSHNPLQDVGLAPLAALAEWPFLRRLTLQLQCTAAGPATAGVLARLKDAPALRSLELCLGGNSLGDLGCAALAGLASSTTLESIVLQLSDNDISAAGAITLLRLKRCPSLSTLRLMLGRNVLTGCEVGQFAGLWQHSSLTAVLLDLSNCELAASRLASLRAMAAAAGGRCQITIRG